MKPRTFFSLANQRAERSKPKTHKSESYHEKTVAKIRSWYSRNINTTTLATCVIAGATIFSVVVAKWQWETLGSQLTVMETEKRPWLRTQVSIVGPVIFTDWGGSKGINMHLRAAVKNYGEMPAVNVRLWPTIAVHPGNPRRQELDKPQTSVCDSAIVQDDEAPLGGVAIFPTEDIPIESGLGLVGIYQTNPNYSRRQRFKVGGCSVIR